MKIFLLTTILAAAAASVAAAEEEPSLRGVGSFNEQAAQAAVKSGYHHHGYHGGGGGSNDSKTTYVADLGEYGEVTMLVDGDEFDMDINLENINGDMFPTGAQAPDPSVLAFHLHSGQVGRNMKAVGAFADGSEDLCGPSYTLGHYDPEDACGPASTAKSAPPVGTSCDPDADGGYVCDEEANQSGCEIGDLSGRYGKVDIDVAGEGEKEIDDGSCPGCDGDYLENPEEEDSATYETWRSIVFHAFDATGGENNGKRLLCANFVRQDN